MHTNADFILRLTLCSNYFRLCHCSCLDASLLYSTKTLFELYYLGCCETIRNRMTSNLCVLSRLLIFDIWISHSGRVSLPFRLPTDSSTSLFKLSILWALSNLPSCSAAATLGLCSVIWCTLFLLFSKNPKQASLIREHWIHTCTARAFLSEIKGLKFQTNKVLPLWHHSVWTDTYLI